MSSTSSFLTDLPHLMYIDRRTVCGMGLSIQCSVSNVRKPPTDFKRQPVGGRTGLG